MKKEKVNKHLKKHIKSVIYLVFFTVSFQSLAQPSNGLIAHYKLDGNGADSSGNGNSGTVIGSVMATTDRFGNTNSAMEFSGGYIDAGNPTDLQLTDSMTIAAWINPTSIPDWSAIVNKWDGIGGYYLGINPVGSIAKWNQGSSFVEGNTVPTGIWTHLAATFDGSTIRFYQNGIEVNSTNSSTSITNNTSHFLIGRQSNWQSVGGSYDFNGIIDDVLVYDRALTSCEVSNLYQNPGQNPGVDIITACDSYIWIDGNTYTSSNNTATFNIVGGASNGCDSVVTLDLTITNSNSGTDIQTACDSYTWIDGITYTSSNNSATFTLTNASGCDSTVTLDLTITNSNSGTDVQTACDSYTWIDGNTYTTSNNSATVMLSNSEGCDSLVTLDLSINNSYNTTDIQGACDSLTWIDGITYTSSNNTATMMLTSIAGCDSLVTLDLTIDNSLTATDVQTACDSYTWIDGNTYTSSNNTATVLLTASGGCDSLVTLDLTIGTSNTGTDVQSACDSYTWIDGITYTTSNNSATFTLTNASGCDSTVTLDLTINSVSDVTTSISGVTITANNTGATYQWLDCDNNYSVINAETGQSFTATANGNYSVELTENGCIDTTSCVAITTVGIEENSFGNKLIVYPNPTNGNFSIDLGDVFKSSIVSITDFSGKLIDSKTISQSQILNLSIDEPNGIYIVTIQAGDKKAIIRLVRE